MLKINLKNYQLTLILLSTSFLVACGGNQVQPTNTAASALPMNEKITSISLPQIAFVKSGPDINHKAVTECNLPAKFSVLFKKQAEDKGISVKVLSEENSNVNGYYLKTEFTHIHNGGNAFIGHRKYTQMQLILFKDGKPVSQGIFGRTSGGGMFAGFKGSCSVLGRTVEANAEDAVKWLENPVNNSYHGDS
ncbi:hypothetical protein THMIRHAM_08820 [Thiomicrorhabdus immobilis]|uniref:DUF4410 domain-containing protein n=1 Tax=Thiomicrorhabdus immobilis TaxID=2791037 RepID=A0ABM7MCI5_9GAMM|nr:hypothetical protein [Thiomicrorhabdus immobilis]BCN93097.1 hypothetical protein THMIRHAM_08820 [Thiomicrorhabdus immobilis]